jgi:hypothetical protein
MRSIKIFSFALFLISICLLTGKGDWFKGEWKGKFSVVL